jgi:hypothetical protein
MSDMIESTADLILKLQHLPVGSLTFLFEFELGFCCIRVIDVFIHPFQPLSLSQTKFDSLSHRHLTVLLLIQIWNWNQTLSLLMDIMNLRSNERIVVKKTGDGEVFWKKEAPVKKPAVLEECNKGQACKELTSVDENKKTDKLKAKHSRYVGLSSSDKEDTTEDEVSPKAKRTAPKPVPKPTTALKPAMAPKRNLTRKTSPMVRVDFEPDDFVDYKFSQGMDYGL